MEIRFLKNSANYQHFGRGVFNQKGLGLLVLLVLLPLVELEPIPLKLFYLVLIVLPELQIYSQLVIVDGSDDR